MSFIRSVLAVIAGILLGYGLPWLLEGILVQSNAGGRPGDAAAYFAVRNTAGIITARLAMALFLSILAGHMAARIAREDAVRTVAISASALSVMLMWDYTGGELAWGTPVWMKIAILLISGPAMLLGAYARAAAAELRTPEPEPEHEPRSQNQEG